VQSLLTVRDLRIEVDAPDVGWTEAVSSLDFCLDRGESLGIVGESGCGKSLTALALLGLLPGRSVRRVSGEMVFDNVEMHQASAKEMRAIRGAGIGFVPQDPMTALNPVYSVGEQVAETIRLHQGSSRKEANERAVELLSRVGVSDVRARFRAYPHELSGGQRQRVLIAIALAGDPELLVADEPTTALDVTVQAQVLRLLDRLRRDRALGLLLITHDLAVVSQVCEQVLILYAGRVVERGPSQEVLRNPRHPYTRGLLSSLPSAGTSGGRLRAIQGTVPGLGYWPSGCRFRDRCGRAEAVCAREEPPLKHVGGTHYSECHFLESVDG